MKKRFSTKRRLIITKCVLYVVFALCILGVILLLLNTCTTRKSSPRIPLDDSLNALNRILSNIMQYSNHVIADLVFGIVLTKGQIHVLLRHLENAVRSERSTFCVEDVAATITQLRDLDHKCDRFIKAAKPNILKSGAFYDAFVDRFVDPEKWNVDQPLKVATLPQPRAVAPGGLPVGLRKNLTKLWVLDGNTSNLCISEVIGASGHRCSMSPRCRRFVLTNKMDGGYTLTHRLLFVQAARQFGCNLFLTEAGTARLIRHFCSMILHDAQLIADMSFPPGFPDMFVETVALCGIEGFSEFMRPDWMKEILTWQQPSGCFVDELVVNVLLNKTRRHKRDEYLLGGDCLMHFTGVAAAAIAASLRFSMQCIS